MSSIINQNFIMAGESFSLDDLEVDLISIDPLFADLSDHLSFIDVLGQLLLGDEIFEHGFLS